LGLKKLALGIFRPASGCCDQRRIRGTGWIHSDDSIRSSSELIGSTRLIERELGGLSASTHARAVALAKLPDVIRGYEGVKRKNVEKFRAAVQQYGRKG
jgi:indolepyruvate ferredoxin oxidoreductase